MEGYVKRPQEYLALLWRGKALMLAIVAAFSIAGVVIATKLPAIYRSTATVLIEAAEVPGAPTSGCFIPLTRTT